MSSLFTLLMLAGLRLSAQDTADSLCTHRGQWQEALSDAYRKGERALTYEFATRLQAAADTCGEDPDEDLFYRAMLAFFQGDSSFPTRIAESVARAEVRQDSFEIVRALYMEGVMDFQRARQTSGAEKIWMANRWFRRHAMPVLAATSYFNLAYLYESVTQNGRAFEVCREGLAYLDGREMDAQKRESMRARLLLMASHVMQGTASYSDAEVLLDSSIVILQALKDTSSLISAWIQLAGIQVEMEEVEASIATLDQAKAMVDTTQPQSWFVYAQLQYVYANSMFDSGKVEQALQSAQLSQAFFMRLGLKSDYYEARALEASFLAQTDAPNALRMLKEVFFPLKQEAKYDFLTDVTRYLALAYTQQGQTDSAIVYWKYFVEIQDSLHSKDKNKALEFARTEFQTAEKERLIEQRELELAQSTELARSQERFLWTLGIGLGIVVLLGGLAVRAYWLARRASEKLGRQNEEKALLLREIHHRVRNNLQVVSNLLEMQSRGIEDPQVIALTREGQSRIRSISLIHQRLYQNESLTIAVDVFMGRLVEETSKLFKQEGVNISLEIEAVELDIDTAVPVGLMLNELLTNAYKYAFQEGVDKELHVWLKRINAHEFEMGLRDNGPGLPAGVDPLRSRSTGLRLVRRLAEQLHGNMTYRYQNGATFVVEFKDTLARKDVE